MAISSYTSTDSFPSTPAAIAQLGVMQAALAFLILTNQDDYPEFVSLAMQHVDTEAWTLSEGKWIPRDAKLIRGQWALDKQKKRAAKIRKTPAPASLARSVAQLIAAGEKASEEFSVAAKGDPRNLVCRLVFEAFRQSSVADKFTNVSLDLPMSSRTHIALNITRTYFRYDLNSPQTEGFAFVARGERERFAKIVEHSRNETQSYTRKHHVVITADSERNLKYEISNIECRACSSQAKAEAEMTAPGKCQCFDYQVKPGKIVSVVCNPCLGIDPGCECFYFEDMNGEVSRIDTEYTDPITGTAMGLKCQSCRDSIRICECGNIKDAITGDLHSVLSSPVHPHVAKAVGIALPPAGQSA